MKPPSRDVNSNTVASKKMDPVRKIGLFLADQAFSGLIVGPLTVFVWWGSWNYLNTYLFPLRLNLSGLICFVIGNVGITILALTQALWKKYVSADNAIHWVFVYHLYTCLCFFCNMCHWRGMWLILDFYTGVNYLSCWITYGIGQGLLMVLRSSKNAQAPPMIIVYDRDPEFFTYTTRFRVKPEWSDRFVYDVLFTVVIIQQLVVFYWRGSWELMDLYIFPDNRTYSALVSFGIAYGLMIILCFVQPLFNFIFLRLSPKIKQRRFLLCWFLEILSYFMSNFACVSLWRGVWITCDICVLPDQPDLGHGVIMAAGLVGLMLMMCGHSLAIRGCEIDGDYESLGDSVCLCPNFYFRRIFGLRSTQSRNLVSIEENHQTEQQSILLS